MENQPKLNSSKEVIAFLAERFPLCFSAEGETRPLKIGIFQDLVGRVEGEMSLSKTQLRSALRLYTSSWRYLHGIKAGAIRVDLDGNPCGALEEQHVEHARLQLAEAKARVQTRRAEQLAKKREAAATAPTGENTPDTPRRESKPRPTSAGPKTKAVVTDAAVTNKVREEKSTTVASPAVKAQKTTPREEKRESVKDITALQVGQVIKVTAGNNAMEATILEIIKDGVRVQLTSGMAMIVRAEHLQF